MDNLNVITRRAVLKGIPCRRRCGRCAGVAVAHPPGKLAELFATYHAAYAANCATIDPLDEAEDRMKKLPPLVAPLSLAPDGAVGSGYLEIFDGREDNVPKELATTHAQSA